MKKSKFFRFFNTLNEKEQQKFKQFTTVLYTKQKKSILLLDYIYTHKENDSCLTKSLAHLEVFKKPMNTKKEEKNILNALSDLTKWLENFLICEAKEPSSFYRNMYISKFYQERELHLDYNGILNYAKRKIETSKEYYWSNLQCFILNDFQYFNPQNDKHQLDNNTLIQANNNLDLFYFLTKFRYACELGNRAYILGEKNINLIHPELEKFINSYPNDNSTIKTYRLLLNLITTRTQEAFNKFKIAITQYNLKDKALHLSFLLYGANFSASKIRDDEKYYAMETYNLYQFGLDSKLLIYEGIFPEMPFKNIVNLYCYLKDISGALDFVKSWNEYLPKSLLKIVSSLCYARIFFEGKEYDKGISLLNQCQFQNAYYDIEARILKARLFFEINEFETSTQVCIALENFLRRNKQISPSFKLSCLNFAKITRRIINQKKKATLHKAIRKAKFIICLPWLTEKINLLPE